MVRGLVHHQAAGVLLVAMPAAEVVGAVAGVEQPVEVHREHLADDAGHEQVLDLGARRRVAVVEGDPHVRPVLLLRVDDALALLRVGGHRLLGDHVAAQLHRPADVVRRGGVLGGDDHAVRLGSRRSCGRSRRRRSS